VNEFKGTPGPWEIGTPEAQGEGLHAPIHGVGHGELAMVVWQMADDKFDRIRSVSCEANARLIAAAPELLEALQLAFGMAKIVHRDTDEVWAAAKQQIESAIAKALGEQQ
jgi:hypothetical protein